MLYDNRNFKISIHAPLTGSDSIWVLGPLTALYFNPRSPYGERHGIRDSQQMGSYFNPRSPYGERLAGSGGNRTV